MDLRIFKTINPDEKTFLLATSEYLPPNPFSPEQTIEYLKEASKTINAVGLHARQIGINDNIFILIDKGEIFPFIHPDNVELIGEMNYEIERCYSEVDKDGKMLPYHVGRTKTIVFDTDDKKQISFEGYFARVCQHEMDHAKGILLSVNPKAKFCGPVVLPKIPERNSPCSCGSGKKYKKCCGVN